MKRQRVLSAFAFAMALALMGSLVAGLSMRGAVAHDMPMHDHPIVGTWLADTDPETEDDGLDLFVFNGDGTYVDVEPGGSTLLGAWEATGPTTANLTIVAFEGDDEGNVFGSITIRASFEVSADGNSLTGQYTFEFTYPDGASSGQAGPGTVTGTRLVVEGPGTPVMTLEELFGSFDGQPEASPGATPAP